MNGCFFGLFEGVLMPVVGVGVGLAIGVPAAFQKFESGGRSGWWTWLLIFPGVISPGMLAAFCGLSGTCPVVGSTCRLCPVWLAVLSVLVGLPFIYAATFRAFSFLGRDSLDPLRVLGLSGGRLRRLFLRQVRPAIAVAGGLAAVRILGEVAMVRLVVEMRGDHADLAGIGVAALTGLFAAMAWLAIVGAPARPAGCPRG